MAMYRHIWNFDAQYACILPGVSMYFASEIDPFTKKQRFEFAQKKIILSVANQTKASFLCRSLCLRYSFESNIIQY